MARLRNHIVLVLLLVNFVYCENETGNPICIYTEGGKICGSGESVEPEDAVTAEGSDVHIQSDADDVVDTGPVAEGLSSSIDNVTITNSSISNGGTSNNSSFAETNAVNISNTDSNAVSAESNRAQKSDASTSNLTATNTHIQEPSASPAETNIGMERNASIVDEENTSKQENSPGVDESNKNTDGGSAEVIEANSMKQENSGSVAEANSNLQESPAVAAEGSSNIEDSSAVAAERNAMQERSDNGGSNTSTLSNATSEIQNSEQAVKKNQKFSENVAEDPTPAEAAAEAEGIETAGAQSGERETSQSEESTSNLSPAESVALAEGIVMAGAILQGAAATPPPANSLSDAEAVALAEGMEMAQAVLEAAREDEPAVNAIWKATLEAESTWKQDVVPENEETLDKGLLSFLVCVMIVLAITGSVSGWVLFTRLRRTPEEDQPPNMYILVDNYDPTFVDCPLDVNDSEGVSYVFPGVGNQTSS